MARRGRTPRSDRVHENPDHLSGKGKKHGQKGRVAVQQRNLMRKWRIPSRTKSPSSNSSSSTLHGSPSSSHAEDEQAMAIIPRDLGEAFVDTDDVISRTHSPDITNIAALWYWMQVDTLESSNGWLGGIKPFWQSLIFQNGPCEGPYLAIAMYFALRRYGQLTSANTEKYAIRAKVITLRSLQSYTEVSPCLLVIIGNLALLAMAEGDLAIAKTHWKALASFSDYKLEDPAAWAFVNGLDVRFAANLMVKPALPYHLPQAFRKPVSLSPDELSRGFRLGSANALEFSKLLEAYYLRGQHLFVNIHNLITISSTKDFETGPIFGLIYDTAYKNTTLVATFKDETPSRTSHYREILGIAVSLAFWTASSMLIPHEGIIQFNLIGRASALLRMYRSVFVKELSTMVAANGTLWIIMTISLQAWIYRPEDFSLWTGVLEQVLRMRNIKAIDFQTHAQQWPYFPPWLDLIDYKPMILIEKAKKPSTEQLRLSPRKLSLVL